MCLWSSSKTVSFGWQPIYDHRLKVYNRPSFIVRCRNKPKHASMCNNDQAFSSYDVYIAGFIIRYYVPLRSPNQTANQICCSYKNDQSNIFVTVYFVT